MRRFIYATSGQRKEHLILQARSNPCVDCVAAGNSGMWPVEAMQLDHLPRYEKRMSLSWKSKSQQASSGVAPPYHYFSVAEVIEEISHCEPVCANHHGVRTKMRNRTGWRQEQAGQAVMTFQTEPKPPPGHRSWYELLLCHNPNIWD